LLLNFFLFFAVLLLINIDTTLCLFVSYCFLLYLLYVFFLFLPICQGSLAPN